VHDHAAELIQWGAPGPLAKTGTPREAYLSPLTDEDADALLAELNLSVGFRSLPGRPHENWAPGSGVTDGEAIARIRREQGALRAHLLSGRTDAACSVCGRDVPANLLVAGHIIPRAELSDDERHQFEAIAMLICLLGCDALFEYGYVVVDEGGVIAPGRTTHHPTLTAEVTKRVGNKSPAWSDSNSLAFRAHELRHAP
jgi:hypothetical protein